MPHSDGIEAFDQYIKNGAHPTPIHPTPTHSGPEACPRDVTAKSLQKGIHSLYL